MWVTDYTQIIQPIYEPKILRDSHCVRKSSNSYYELPIFLESSIRESEFRNIVKKSVVIELPVYKESWKRSEVIDEIDYFYEG